MALGGENGDEDGDEDDGDEANSISAMSAQLSSALRERARDDDDRFWQHVPREKETRRLPTYCSGTT